ncbi:PilZ domain-containing protein [Sedimentibacter sp. MB31-C6]|uniref:PilZ domain-containing protein n=1 Tax=Sedimentibacter sp. MB31-C6 TaxID=3109366 RepID=UPI002DDD6067|nr:PilZ domain-containing protein [Sedimentibacter sp. MB36-C1]WSI04959.1 PilZ domain-containing protein [Sedimentibacter sp. MB36-C1]
MINRSSLVKIYDFKKEFIGKGRLLNLNKPTIIVKGNNLPVLSYDTKIYIYVYDSLKGIFPYLCKVSVASSKQITANIIGVEPVIERRTALKVNTNLTFYLDKIYRDDEDLTEDLPRIKINLHNLSIRGMLISSNFEFQINDRIIFCFKTFKSTPIFLEAKVIRIDDIIDEETNNVISNNYGCIFLNTSNSDESIILKYLFDRQLQLYKGR